MTADQIRTQTRFNRADSEMIAAETDGRPAIEPFFWAMVEAGYDAVEIRDLLRALFGLLK